MAILIRSKEDVQCDDCLVTVTPEEMKKDVRRVYKTKDGQTLCEECYENLDLND